MKYCKFLPLFFFSLLFTNCFSIYNDDYYGDCKYINQELNNEPITIYTLTYSNRTNNIFISKNEIKDDSITTLLYKVNKKSSRNQFEFITITSNDSVLIQEIGEEPFIISDSRKESPFSYRWDKPLYHPYLSYKCNNSFANITAITYSTLNNNNINSSYLSVLSGSVYGVDNVNNFEHVANISINPKEINLFRSVFDRVNLLHYSYIKEKDKDNYYLIVTNLNNNNSGNETSTYLINIGLDFNSVGLCSNNGTIVLGGYDSKSNTTKFYQILINTSLNNNTSQNNSSIISVKLLFEQPIKITNFIKSSNSNYLLFYSTILNKLLVYNISTMKLNSFNITIKGRPYKESSNDDYESFNIQDIYASGAFPSISNTKLSVLNSTNNKNNSTFSHNKVLIISIVVICISLLLFGFLGFYIFYIRKNRINNNFKKIIESNNKEKQYPDDNITILLKNYR